MTKALKTLLLLLPLLPAIAIANPITRQQAQQNALFFLKNKGKGINHSSLRQAPSRSSLTVTESYYVFNIGNDEGYIIASGDDCAPAILGYSDSGYIDIDSMPENMKSWLEEYAQQIQFMQEKGYSPYQQPELSSNLPAIPPLLTTTWGQDDPYNQNCPDFFVYGKCVTGCVATAMAQVMHYHRSNSVNHTTATIPAYRCSRTWDFGNGPQQIYVDSIPAGAVIEWDWMRDSYSGLATTRQRRAVANLMKYCGAAVQMEYANAWNGGSSAYSSKVPIALKTYFNYNNATTIKSRNHFSSDDEWNSLIYDELRNSRPVYYSGSNNSSGHAFVCDGFDGAGYYHINWGWDGSYNGHFLLTALAPTGGPSSGYNQNQQAMINAFPKPNNPVTSEIINFADANVKAICVRNWDFDGDGEFSKAEAAAVTTLNNVFRGNRNITSFDELVYFTGLSRIGNDVFYGCSSMTSITLPNSVTKIGDNAFTSCSELTNITLPNSVTAIGDNAFAGCISLMDVPIPSSVTTIGKRAFMSCSSLTSVTIPISVTAIGGGAFSNCSGLTSLVVAKRNSRYDSRDNCNAIIETASNSLISGCLNTIIPNSVTSIGEFAFYYCSDMTSMTIPNSVTAIGQYAFAGCSGLTSLTIPNSVIKIGNYAFYYCRGLTSTTIGNSVTSIGDWAFAICSGLTSITIPNSVTAIGEYAFAGCSQMTSATIGNSITHISPYMFISCYGLTSVTIPNSVTAIGESAFQSCSGLTSVTIPNSVISIGEMAFVSCSGLTSVTIPNSVTSIGESAFRRCSSLTSVTIPNSVTTIGKNAFVECSSVTSIIVDNGNPIYDSRNNSNAIIETASNTLIVGCTTTVIPNSATSIGESAFYWCSGLTSMTIPNSVTAIGDYAFCGCSGLTNVTIPNSVTTIGRYAFASCSGLKSVAIPNSVTAIGENTFASCSGLTSVTIPNSAIAIGNYAFYACSGLTSVTIPNSVTTIGNYAFYACRGLTSVTIPNSVTAIGENTFASCSGLTSVTISKTVTEIGFAAFANCSNLKDIFSHIIDVSRVAVGRYAFYNSDSDYSGRTLHVLRGATDAYQADENWYPYFGQIVEIVLGDVNCDLEVNIADVNAAIDIILNGNGYTIIADVNDDGETNIADVNALIDMILSH